MVAYVRIIYPNEARYCTYMQTGWGLWSIASSKLNLAQYVQDDIGHSNVASYMYQSYKNYLEVVLMSSPPPVYGVFSRGHTTYVAQKKLKIATSGSPKSSSPKSWGVPGRLGVIQYAVSRASPDFLPKRVPTLGMETSDTWFTYPSIPKEAAERQAIPTDSSQAIGVPDRSNDVRGARTGLSQHSASLVLLIIRKIVCPIPRCTRDARGQVKVNPVLSRFSGLPLRASFRQRGRTEAARQLG